MKILKKNSIITSKKTSVKFIIPHKQPVVILIKHIITNRCEVRPIEKTPDGIKYKGKDIWYTSRESIEDVEDVKDESVDGN